MGLLSIILVLIFSVILCIIEIPKMYNSKLYKDLTVFLFILCCGIILTVLEGLNIKIPNPSDLVTVVYSPISKLMKDLLE